MMTRLAVQADAREGIRPFDIRHDLLPLANLIEVAFHSELEQTGNPIVSEMRRLASMGPLLWLTAFPGAFSPLMSGYVWVANGQLVGNVTLSLESGRGGLWSISNVAVHPSFRGRDIARHLMEAALQEAWAKGAQTVVLEVQADNVPAQQLYRDLGFRVYDTIVELSLPRHKWTRGTVPPSLALRKRRPGDWRGLHDLLAAATPAKVQEVKPVLAYQQRMGLGQRLERWLDDLLYRRQSSDWVLEENRRITAFLQVTGQYTQAAHRLQINVHPDRRGTIEEELLAAGLYKLNCFPAREVVSTVSISHPEAQKAFHDAGFHTIRVLDQMQLDLRPIKWKGEKYA